MNKKILCAFALLICFIFVIVFLPACSSKEKQSQYHPLAARQQTTDPVNGLPVNKNYSSEYDGQTVYFNSQESKNTFDKNPGKYFSNPPYLRH